MKLIAPSPLTLTAGDVRNVEAKLQHAIAQMHAEYDAASRSIVARRALTHGMAVVLRELSILSEAEFDAIATACRVRQGYEGRDRAGGASC